MTNIQELLSILVWLMTGEEFILLSKHGSGQAEALPQPVTDTEKKYVYGILGIAKLFGCSLPTANRIKTVSYTHLKSNTGSRTYTFKKYHKIANY